MDDSYGPETFTLSGPTLDQAAINYLENSMNKSGEIWIENIIYEGSETAAKEEKLILYFNQ